MKDEVRRQFTRISDLERLLPLFDRSGVRTRHFAFPKDYYLDGKSFGRRNDDYLQVAETLGAQAIRTALAQASLDLDSAIDSRTVKGKRAKKGGLSGRTP